MGQKSTLQRVVDNQLGIHGMSLESFLKDSDGRTFTELRDEITMRTGVKLSTRTLRRWRDELSRMDEAS